VYIIGRGEFEFLQKQTHWKRKFNPKYFFLRRQKGATFHSTGFRAGDLPSVTAAWKETSRSQLSDLYLVVSRKTEPNFEDKWSKSQLYTLVT